MKRIAFIITGITIMFFFGACNNKKQEVKKQQEGTVYQLEKLLEVAAENVEKQVVVKGSVTHTCKHSGKRCFIVGNDPNTSLRIEAKGTIEGFKSDLIGSEIEVIGILKERRLTKEYIDQHAEKIKVKQLEEDGSAESCQAEMENIQKMRDWMKMHNKDYYSIYYIDGESYKVVES